MTYYDSVKRIVRAKGGQTRWIKIARYKCKKCNEIHRDIPDTILPYKHYEASIIENVINGNISSDMLEYEDYPCEMTMKRWCSQ